MHTRWVIICAIGSLGIGSGCGAIDELPAGASSLTGIVASGAVMGQKGRLRVEFSNPLGAATDVMLSSGSPGIATVPDRVTVPAGAVSTIVEYSAVAPGRAVFEAIAGGETQTATALVVDMLRLTTSAGATFEAGAKGIITPDVNITLPEPLTLTLTSSQPSIASVDGEMTIAAFRSSGLAQIHALSPGASVITATLGGQQATHTLTVIDKARIVQVYGTRMFEVGGHGYAQVELNAQLANAAQITVTSSDPSVISVGRGYAVAEGSNYAYLDLEARAVGSTNVTFTLNGSSGTLPVAVLTKAQLQSLTTIGTPSVGDSTQLSVHMNVTAATAHDVTLTSSDPSVIAVPPTVTVFAGTSSGTATITPAKVGSAVITATYNGISRQIEVQAGNSGYALNLYGQSRLVVGAIGQFSVQTGSSAPTIVNLTSSDPAVLSVPESIAVSYSEAVPVSVHQAGDATITASANGATARFPVTVVATPGISTFGPFFTVPVNGTITGYLYLEASPRAGTPLSFTTSDASIAPAPDTVSMTSGQTYVPLTIRGGNSGTAILTARVAGSTSSAVLYVGGATNGVFQSVFNSGASSTLELGAATMLSAHFSPSPQNQETGAITFSTPGIATTSSATLPISSSVSSNYFPVVAAVAGTTDVTVTVAGVSKSTTITVVSAPTYTIHDLTTVRTNAVVMARIQSNALLAADRTFSLTSSNPNVAAVTSTTATIGPGSSNSMQTLFGVRGVAPGTATITAAIGGRNIVASVTVAN